MKLKNNKYLKISKNNKISKNTMTHLDYDRTVDNKYRATISLGQDINVSETSLVDIPDNSKFLTYDDVEDVFFKIMDKKYPIETFPKSNIIDIEVFCNETGKWYKVFRESDKKAIDKHKKTSNDDRYLVLPEYTYSITPEAKLWMNMMEKGFISENSEFDFDKMHSIIENMKETSK